MGIQVQQRKADEVLKKLSVFPLSFVAGGAPANWYQGLKANDIDVFMTLPHPSKEEIEEVLGVEITPLMDVEYEGSGFTGYEWEDEEGQKFQILLHNVNCIEEVFSKFPFSVCKAAYLGEGRFVYGDLFELSIRYKFVKDDCTPCGETFYSKKREQYSVTGGWLWAIGRKQILMCMGRKWQAEYANNTGERNAEERLF